MKLFASKKDKAEKAEKAEKKEKKEKKAAAAGKAAPAAGGEAASRAELLRAHGLAPDVRMRLADFRIVRTVGTGSFGRVVVAEYAPTGRFYAVKAQSKKDIVRLKQVPHVRDEKALLARLGHPNIVNLVAWFQDPARLFLVLEFVSGGEMFTFLRRAQRFPESRVQLYTAQIVSAFAYLHERHIAYRDLKPENLLFDDKGNVKVTDFGFAKVVKERTYTVCGTPEYIAPEIIRSQGHNYNADWWALGVLIYEMIAGYPPFFADSPLGIYEKILSDKPVSFGRYFSKEAKDLIRGLLQQDMTKRLGCMKNGVRDIQKHKFFAGVDWDAIAAGTVTPEWAPPQRAKGDAGNFDKYQEQDLTKCDADDDQFGDTFADW